MRLTVIDWRLFSDWQKHVLENFGKNTVVAAEDQGCSFLETNGKNILIYPIQIEKLKWYHLEKITRGFFSFFQQKEVSGLYICIACEIKNF